MALWKTATDCDLEAKISWFPAKRDIVCIVYVYCVYYVYRVHCLWLTLRHTPGFTASTRAISWSCNTGGKRGVVLCNKKNTDDCKRLGLTPPPVREDFCKLSRSNSSRSWTNWRCFSHNSLSFQISRLSQFKLVKFLFEPMDQLRLIENIKLQWLMSSKKKWQSCQLRGYVLYIIAEDDSDSNDGQSNDAQIASWDDTLQLQHSVTVVQLHWWEGESWDWGWGWSCGRSWSWAEGSWCKWMDGCWISSIADADGRKKVVQRPSPTPTTERRSLIDSTDIIPVIVHIFANNLNCPRASGSPHHRHINNNTFDPGLAGSKYDPKVDLVASQ